MDGEILSDFFEESEFCEPDDIFTILEAMESASGKRFEFRKSSSSSAFREAEAGRGGGKRQKLNAATASAYCDEVEEGRPRMRHITVERNRRKQMNEHLSVLRSLMPCFYVKRGDQATIIGGVVDYINELQQLLQTLEAKKQRKTYCEVVSPKPSPMISPRKPPLSPRLRLPISPSTPQPSSTYKPWMQPGYLNSPSLPSPIESSPCNSSTSSINDAVNELVASSKSPLAEVEVKFSGPNLLLKTVSHRIPGQVIKIVSALEELELKILHLKISTVDERMMNCFTIKIGIECKLSAEELAQQIQKTFC